MQNYVLGSIKFILFKWRARDLGGDSRVKVGILFKEIKAFISSDLQLKFINAKQNKYVDKFQNTFLIDNILGILTNGMKELQINI